jgi:hypothetical protein
MAYSNIRPELDMGMPIGYLNTNTARILEPIRQVNPRQASLNAARAETEALEAEVAAMEEFARQNLVTNLY